MDARNEVRDEAVKHTCIHFQDALSQGYVLNITQGNQTRQHVDTDFDLYDGADNPDPEMPVDNALPETSEGDTQLVLCHMHCGRPLGDNKPFQLNR
jgi:hypothetical protein